MKHLMKLLLSALLLCCTITLYAQSEYDSYLQKAEERLRQGDCISAEKNYNVYKEMSGKSDTKIERMIEECKTPSATKRSGNFSVTINGYSFTMIYVQGGTFTMGCTSEQGSDCEEWEKPAHNVTLSSYHIGKFEVTQGLWKAVMGSNPSYFKGDNLPVENVSWEDAQDFIVQLSRLTGRKFRLPTEAEWEYAARGGRNSVGTKYSGAYSLNNCGWYADNSGSRTHAVGTKNANELGIYDMSGNVWEWCSDWYGSYSSSSQTNPTGPYSGSSRVLRGGSWFSYARICRSSYRRISSPGYRGSGGGFRLACSTN